MKIRNKRGPRIDPCGTPAVIEDQSEDARGMTKSASYPEDNLKNIPKEKIYTLKF